MFDKTSGATLDYHRSMLTDEARTRALEGAIRATVRPGDTVLDLGCGSGVLACFACRAGARRVYAVEMEPIIQLARAVCRNNGFADRVVFLDECSTQVTLPEQVDVVVTETVGNLGFEEGILGWVGDARRRLLKPGGRMIPRSIALFAAPVELPGAYAGVSAWSQLPYGLDFSAARTLAANNPIWTQVPAEAVLGEPALLGKVDLLSDEGDAFQGSAQILASRSGTCHGIGVWFRAELTRTSALSSAPPIAMPSWNHGVLPLEQPIEMQSGEGYQVAVDALANGSQWQWRIDRLAANPGVEVEDGARWQSTVAGQFLSMSELRKGAGHYVPQLGRKGEVSRFILESMDGTLSLDGIAAAVLDRFDGVFPDPRDASDLVRKLSRRYAQ